MKTHVHRLVSMGLLLSVLGDWAIAAPAPPHLAELAPFKMERHELGRIGGLSFSADSKTLFSTYRNESVWLWDVATRKHTATFDPAKGGRFNRMVRSPDGKTAAVLCGKTIELWDVLNRKHIGSLEEDEGIDRMLFSPDGKTLSVADRISRPPVRGELRIAELRIWDVEKRKRLRSCKTHSLVPVGMAGPMKKPVMVDTSVNFGRLRRLDEPVKTIPFNLVDAFTGDKVVAYEWDIKDGMMPSCFVVNRDETILATAGINSSVHLWDRNSGKRLARFKPPPSACQGLGFSPDGNILLFLYGRGHMEGFLLYAVPSGKILADEKHSSLGLVFSPDGRLLAGEGFREIKLWSIPEQWRKKDK